MPAAPIVGAVVAAVAAVEATTTAVAVFATIAAIGSAAAAVGQIAGVKELAIAGTVLGAVGMVGGLATSANLFGAADFFNGVTNTAGGAAENVAASAVTAAPGPEGGYSWNALQADPTSGLQNVPSDVISQANGGTSNIVDTVAASSGATAAPSITPTTAEAPNVTPVAEPNAPSGTASIDALASKPVAETGGPAVGPEKPGLINQDYLNPDSPVPDAMKGVMPNATEGVNPAEQFNSVGVDPATQNPLMQTGDVAQTQIDPATAYADGSSYNGTEMAQGDGGPSSSPAGQNGENATGTLLTRNTQAQPAKFGSIDELMDKTGIGNMADVASTGKVPSTEDMLGWKDTKLGDISRTSPWSGVFDFLKNNDKYVLGALQAGGSFLNGAMSPLTPASVEALNAQAERNRAAANLENMQAQQLQRRMNNASGRIYGTYTPYSTGGLINGPAVTGRPA